MKILGMNKEMQELFKLKLLCDLMTNVFMYVIKYHCNERVFLTL